MDELTPKKIVEALDAHIVGQRNAKRSVAVALRNRYRRSQLSEALREEILPKNILMIGPTGVGKTEIARRLSRLVKAPFIKVEATKFTEVGYVGRDVESIIRDIVDGAVRMVQSEAMARVQSEAKRAARRRILDLLVSAESSRQERYSERSERREMTTVTDEEVSAQQAERQRRREHRRELARKLDAGELDDEMIEMEVEDPSPSMIEVFSGSGVEELGFNMQDMLGNLFPSRRTKKRMPVSEARRILESEEAQKLIDMDQVTREAVERAENDGIIFLDELDKVAGTKGGGSGPDVSREGVQRDILPIVEGTTVMTKHGPVKSDHMLFIAAGAFHTNKPADLIPELQGRFPVRVELDALDQEDLRRILVEPRHSLTDQYHELLQVDGVTLLFTDDGLDAIAEIAEEVNNQTENIGARRLHTIMEKLLQDIAFSAPDDTVPRISVDRHYVEKTLASIVSDRDLSRYIL